MFFQGKPLTVTKCWVVASTAIENWQSWFAISEIWQMFYPTGKLIYQACFYQVCIQFDLAKVSLRIVFTYFAKRKALYCKSKVPFYQTSSPVRMAERSKAPDSRFTYLPIAQWERAFWSPNGGVGSNPTPDTTYFSYFLSVMLPTRIYRVGCQHQRFARCFFQLAN